MRFQSHLFQLAWPFIVLCFALTAHAQLSEEDRLKASELFQEYQSEATSPDRQDEIAEDLTDMGREVTKRFFSFLNQNWESERDSYQASFATEADVLAQKKKDQTKRAEIETHRETLKELRDLEDRLTEERLKEEGLPALEALERFLLITPQEVVASSSSLKDQREKLLTTLRHRAICLDELADTTHTRFDESDLEESEKPIALARSLIEKKSMQVIERNTRKKGDASDAERMGILDVNLMRAVVGKAALEIDFDLCVASRGHSKDMAEEGFFAHESPVKGKETPDKRAALEGANFAGENIFHGSTDPQEANDAWFTSPGHHLNMFRDHRSVGMGLYGTHWTQMFGR